MTKPKPKLKPFKRVMWVHARWSKAKGWRVSDTGQIVFLYPTKRLCASYGGLNEIHARVLVTILPVAGRGKK